MPGKLVEIEALRPTPNEGEVLLKVKCIGVCGTDIHAYGGNQPFFSYPRVLGHELAGEIVEVGDGVSLPVGASAFVIPYLECGTCVACRNNKPNCCTNIEVIGVHRDGGMSEYLTVPADHVVIADNVSYEELAIVECLAIGAHSVKRASINESDTVMVLGAGPIGLGVAQFAQIAGAKTFVADLNQERLDFCEQEFEFDALINSTSDVKQQLSELTNGEFPTVIIDATGSPKAMESTFEWLAHGGRIVFVSIVKADISFHDPEFHKRETTLLGSRNATKEDFEYVVECMRTNKIKSTTMITHRVKFDDFTTTFPDWVQTPSGVIKAVIEVD